MAQKHAYLIMAHHNFEQLQQLLDLLDDARNDIYLHIDKKAGSFSPQQVHTNRAGLILTERLNIQWAGHSQIQCELLLLKAAAEKHYDYYHLLSGLDLPLKTQDDIHAFFEENHGKEFIGLDKQAIESRNYLDRTQYYYWFQNIYGRDRGRKTLPIRTLEDWLVALQEKMGFRRKELVPLYKGANWFSITDTMVQYVLKQEAVIRKQFFFSRCADEVFLQSIAMASPYRECITGESLRETDWERGSPYTFRAEDVPQLLNCGRLFARKLDRNVDPEAIELIRDALMKK